MTPEKKLTLLDRTMPLVTLAAGCAIAITTLHLMRLDLDRELTANGLIGLALALALGHAAAVGVDSLLARTVTPYRERLRAAIAQRTAPEYPADVALAMEAYLSDLKAGLPLAVEMAGPEGEMPQTGEQWVDYRLHPYRLDALTEWHDQRAA
ncbi:hypothetical protein ACIRPR_33485 [Streptomyces griseoflavus]|uniref:hypothetical protein n=1 Tax=Streptomyces griseoflavus TaxID=35619 RepID=UPI0038110CB6